MKIVMVFTIVFTIILALALYHLGHLAAEDAVDKETKDLEKKKEFLEKIRQEFEEENKTE